MPDNIKAYICENNHTSSAFGRFPGGERHCLDCGAKVWRVEEFLAVAKIPSPSPASDQLREAVEIAAKWFDEYAINHRLKGADTKAETNEFRARWLRKYITRPPQGDPWECECGRWFNDEASANAHHAETGHDVAKHVEPPKEPPAGKRIRGICGECGGAVTLAQYDGNRPWLSTDYGPEGKLVEEKAP